MTSEQKASEISPEMSELDVLMELTGLEDLSEEEKANESEEKNRKNEQDRVKALDMRKNAMETLSFSIQAALVVRQIQPHFFLEDILWYH